jgi:hypothetical protein
MIFEEDFKPRLIELPKSQGKGGALSFIEEGENLPFKVKRIFWIYEVDSDVERGHHGHEFSHRIIVCLQGEIKVEIQDLYGNEYSYVLDSPSQAVYFPPRHWLKTTFKKGAILLSATSHLYEEDHTITDYEDFLALKNF